MPVIARRLLCLLPTANCLLSSILPDRLDRTVVHRVFAERLFFRRLGLLEDVRETLLVVAREIRGRGLAAEVAVDALGVDVETTLRLSGNFIVRIGH